LTDQYVASVIRTLSQNPTGAELDFLVEAFSNIGYLVSEAEGLAEEAENVRKHNEATNYLTVKQSGDKVTDRQAEAQALVMGVNDRKREVEARVKARKLKNLRDSIEQAINAIKFLGRAAG
jgi:hypothetical protein